MAKIDWEAHKRCRQEEYPGLSVAAYARLKSLNVNTARKFMKGDPAPSSSTASDPAEPVKSDPKATKRASDPRKNDPKSGKSDPKSRGAIPKSTAAKRSGGDAGKDKNPIKSGRYKSPSAAAGEGAAHASDPAAAMDSEVENRIVSLEPLRAQDHTGGFVSLLGMDNDIAVAALHLGAGDEDLTLASGRYLQLYRCKEDARRQANEDYDKKELWYYPGTETPMPRSMAVMQAESAAAQRLAELERYMGTRKASLWRQRKAEREEEREREREQLTIEILAQRYENDWSALETAQRLELKGLKLPESLRMEVAREVGFIEPRVDDGGGISDAELEAQSRAYMAEQTELMGSWLPHRREEVAKALAEEVARQNGDLIEEDDFDPLPEAELPAPQWDDDDSEPLTEVEEVWQ
ncbi:hypothetical protein [Aeromonas hydrophila]|uniref:hypothetical protein n=1 Tax=Aeromonas hydrophila TaxID=644 RepID=UPI003D2598A5